MTRYDISIVSDTVCPWCYIGHRRLQSAIRQHSKNYPEDTFSTTWHPFQLNPSAPLVGTDKREMYEAKFGAGIVDRIFARVGAAGAKDGIDFAFGGKTGNTRTSHRLIAYAKEKEGQDEEKQAGLQTRVVEALFKAYFEEEKDITSHEVLKIAGVQAGLDEAEVRKVLASDDVSAAEVDRELKEARMSGINSVPNFVINRKFQVEGAQEVETFQQLFQEMREDS